MLIILEKIFILYIFLCLGYAFGKKKPALVSSTGLLSFLLVNLMLPCKVFTTFANNFTVSYLKESKLTILISVAFLGLLYLTSVPLSKLLTKDRYKRKIYVYSFTISNYAYMGYALTESLFGAEGLTDLILFCIPFAIFTYTAGYMLLTDAGSDLKRVINPMTIAIALGIVCGLCGIRIPDFIANTLSSASACVAPLSMLLTGLTLSAFSFKSLVVDKSAYIYTAIRLIGLPLLVFSICKALSLNSVLPAATMMACMPSGLNTIIFPRNVGMDCTTGAKMAFISHLFSIFTLPLWLTLIQM